MMNILKKPEFIQSHSKISINLFKKSDIHRIVSAFSQASWPKPTATFEAYFREQQNGERLIWVAFVENQFAGYVTLRWRSQYEPFVKGQIPEIMDLNVLPYFRRQGIGSKLLETAEKEAASKKNIVGLGVGLYACTMKLSKTMQQEHLTKICTFDLRTHS